MLVNCKRASIVPFYMKSHSQWAHIQLQLNNHLYHYFGKNSLNLCDKSFVTWHNRMLIHWNFVWCVLMIWFSLNLIFVEFVDLRTSCAQKITSTNWCVCVRNKTPNSTFRNQQRVWGWNMFKNQQTFYRSWRWRYGSLPSFFFLVLFSLWYETFFFQCANFNEPYKCIARSLIHRSNFKTDGFCICTMEKFRTHCNSN